MLKFYSVAGTYIITALAPLVGENADDVTSRLQGPLLSINHNSKPEQLTHRLIAVSFLRCGALSVPPDFPRRGLAKRSSIPLVSALGCGGTLANSSKGFDTG